MSCSYRVSKLQYYKKNQTQNGSRRNLHVMRYLMFFFDSHPRTCLHWFLEREKKEQGGRDRERQMWERYIDWLPPVPDPTRDQTQNSDMWPEWESNWQHFHAWDVPINSATQPRRDPKFPYITSIMTCFLLERIIFMANQTWECFRIPDHNHRGTIQNSIISLFPM